MKQIADCLSVGRSTLYDRMKSDSDVSDAIKRGRSKGVATITNALFQSAKNGNVTAQIFYLKNRDPEKWRDRRELEHSGHTSTTVEHKAAAEARSRLAELISKAAVDDDAGVVSH